MYIVFYYNEVKFFYILGRKGILGKFDFGGKDIQKIIAYCGLICSECPVYIVTQTGNEELKEQLARDYSTETCKFEKMI